MKAARQHLTYANVVATLALFLVLAGGTVYAARVAKKSVGPSQLKAGAVTTAKIKANSITTRKIRRNAVSNAKIKDGAIESAKIAANGIQGSDIDLNSTPFGRVVHEARGSSFAAVNPTASVYPLGGATFTQPANETEMFVGALDLQFAASCAPPRLATATLVIDNDEPVDYAPWEVVARGGFEEGTGGGLLSQRIELAPETTRFAPRTAENHTLYLVMSGTCGSGSGITAVAAAANVIGVK